MQVTEIDIADIKPYEFNNRRHTQEQIDRVASSIKTFGFNQPLVVDENYTVLIGHCRLFSAQALKLKKVPCVVLKKLTEQQKRAYRILDNKLQNDSTWDFNNLELELGWLQDNGADLAQYGLDKLYELFGEPAGGDPNLEWGGMPSFVAEDKKAFQTIQMHFLSPEDVQSFAQLIGQDITESTNSLYYPEQKRKNRTTIAIVRDDDESPLSNIHSK